MCVLLSWSHGQPPAHPTEPNYRASWQDTGAHTWTSAPVHLNPCCISSKLPYDVTTEQALTYPEVRNKLEASIENLRKVTDKVLGSIISSLDLLP